MNRLVVSFVALALCAATSGSASAQSDLGFKSVGAAVGYVSPEDLDGTFSIGVFADHGTITPQIGLESHLDFWSWSEEAYGVEAAVSDISLGARGKYYFEVAHSSIRPFAGAGLGLHFVHAEVTVPPQGGFPEMSAEDSSTKLGLDLGGGMATTIGPKTDLLAEIWYGIVSDVGQFSLRVGMSYKLDTPAPVKHRRSRR
jgi:opacity protein-like surface antigen